MLKIQKGPEKTSKQEKCNVSDEKNILNGINSSLGILKEKISKFEFIAK